MKLTTKEEKEEKGKGMNGKEDGSEDVIGAAIEVQCILELCVNSI